MFRLSAVALLLPVVALAAPVPKEKGKELYFPTTVGAKRVMERKVGNRTTETTETVTKVEEKDGTYTVTVEQDTGRFGAAVTAVSAKGVFRLPYGGKGANEPEPLLKLPAKEGDTWTYEMPAGGPGGGTEKRKYTVGKEEEIEVPAGKFKAVRVDCEIDPGGGRTMKSAMWFAPGVGMVKAESQITLTVTQELKSFTPGNEEKKSDKKEESKKDK